MAISDDREHAAAVTGLQNSERRNARRPRGLLPVSCFQCSRPGHSARDVNRLDRGGATHNQRQSEEKSTTHKYSSRDERFGSRKMIITKREKRSFATVREMESQKNEGPNRKYLSTAERVSTLLATSYI